jgi:3-hydroxybutyrate dehydrogenase
VFDNIFSDHFISGLYALVNNAGVCVCGEFEWQTWSHIAKQVEVNLLGTLRVTKHCIPLLKAGKGRSRE